MKEGKLKVAVIGLGRMGQIHFRHLLYLTPNVLLVAVADAFYDKEEFQSQYPLLTFSNDAEEIIKSPEIDTVVICTPTSTHANLIRKAIEHRKNIFCEKPLDLSLSVTMEVIKMAKDSGIQLMFGFNRRFDTDFIQLKKTVVSGSIGDPQIIKITNRDPGLPPVGFIKNSGGMFMDFTIHDFDMARYIMGKEVIEIFARGLVFIDDAVGEAGDIDTSLVTMIFDDGSYAMIDNSRKAVYGYDQRIEIFGSLGMAEVENNLYNQNVIYDVYGIHQSLPLASFSERYKASYLSEMKLFVDAVIGHRELPVSGEDMIAATALAYAANKSMKENRVVKLSEILQKE